MIGPVARCRRFLFRAGVFGSSSLPRPVVSVGNLAVGGTGKTPHVQWLAAWLKARGVRVAVLSRGYGRRTRGVVWASGGEGERPGGFLGMTETERVGDEPSLLAQTLPGVPVLVGESRLAAGTECLRAREIDVFLLDDGFQHLTLRRDLDIVLIDALHGLGNRRTLPFGPLREPPGHARFADALIVGRCATPEDGWRAVEAVPFPRERPVAFTRLVPCALVSRNGAERPLPAPGQEVVAFSGISRNDRFKESLAAAGFRVGPFFGFRDHHPYRPSDFDRIRSAAAGLPVLTTEKDMVRLPAELPFAVTALRVRVECLEGWDGLSSLVLERIAVSGAR